MLKMYFYLFLEVKKTASYLCDMLSNLLLVSDIFTIDFDKHCTILRVVELHVPN